MTSKEMEARSGVPRANIRYYEAEGLLRPARRGNGYRDYSEEDLRTLEKIKLLRRLGVSIEELRALRDGRMALSAVLDRRLAELGGEQAALGRVEQVCGALRAAGTAFDALEPGKYLSALDAPALPEAAGGDAWWTAAPAPQLPRDDALPGVYSVSRRLFARLFDNLLLTSVLLAAVCLAGYNIARIPDFPFQVGTAALLAVVEPLALRLFGTTPGKALLGMRLTGADGRKLSFGQGVSRYFLMLWHGLGFGIPIWSLVQMYRSAKRCWNEEPQPWDEDTAYIAKPFRARYGVGLALAAALVLLAGEAVNSASQLPPNRGDLTVAEFAENYNRQADYLGLDGLLLDAEGRWQARPREDGVYIDLSLEEMLGMEGWPGTRDLRYTVENGRVTAVTLAGAVENAESGMSTPEGCVPMVVMALTWGREEAPFWSWSRKARLTELERADWSEDFVLRQPGAVITAEVEQRNFYYYRGIGWRPLSDDNALSFTYTVALEE